MTQGRLEIEEVGGFVGYGGASHVRTRGEVELDGLDADERSTIQKLLGRKDRESLPPGPRYRLTWEEDGHQHRLEVGVDDLTPTLRASLKTELR